MDFFKRKVLVGKIGTAIKALIREYNALRESLEYNDFIDPTGKNVLKARASAATTTPLASSIVASSISGPTGSV